MLHMTYAGVLLSWSVAEGGKQDGMPGPHPSMANKEDDVGSTVSWGSFSLTPDIKWEGLSSMVM